MEASNLLSAINIALLIEIPILFFIVLFVGILKLGNKRKDNRVSKSIAAMFLFFLFLTLILVILISSYASSGVSAKEEIIDAEVQANLDNSLVIVYDLLQEQEIQSSAIRREQLENLRRELEDAKNRQYSRQSSKIVYVTPGNGY
ncbi:MAG: hypothetical protein WC867_02305 [Candidatus Pacearchaeota archaeon]|jgi:Na+/H+-dicarboxylate symporter